jgi:hypothetical protein
MPICQAKYYRLPVKSAPKCASTVKQVLFCHAFFLLSFHNFQASEIATGYQKQRFKAFPQKSGL